MHQLMCSNNTNKLSPQERLLTTFSCPERSNNTNKLSPQERMITIGYWHNCSNNTNKLSPQEPVRVNCTFKIRSNNTNKLSPQELEPFTSSIIVVQIIQINLVLKNSYRIHYK